MTAKLIFFLQNIIVSLVFFHFQDKLALYPGLQWYLLSSVFIFCLVTLYEIQWWPRGWVAPSYNKFVSIETCTHFLKTNKLKNHKMLGNDHTPLTEKICPIKVQ